jgi:hypothetical protein
VLGHLVVQGAVDGCHRALVRRLGHEHVEDVADLDYEGERLEQGDAYVAHDRGADGARVQANRRNACALKQNRIKTSIIILQNFLDFELLRVKMLCLLFFCLPIK